MKIKNDLMLRNIMGEWVVVPMGERLTQFNGIMKLNESAAFLWKMMEKEVTREAIVAALLEEYDMDREAAETEVDNFIDSLMNSDMLEE